LKKGLDQELKKEIKALLEEINKIPTKNNKVSAQ
jgi:hypothetical protein